MKCQQCLKLDRKICYSCAEKEFQKGKEYAYKQVLSLMEVEEEKGKYKDLARFIKEELK